MSNWINHVKQYASQKGISYNAALKDSECKSSYHSKKTVPKPVSVPKEIVSVLKQIESVPKQRRTKKTIINIKPIDENKINISSKSAYAFADTDSQPHEGIYTWTPPSDPADDLLDGSYVFTLLISSFISLYDLC